jgi:Tol biopolymer transport system component
VTRRATASLLLTLAATGCDRTVDPTFSPPNPTATPPPGADLIVTSDGLAPGLAAPGPRDVFALSASDGSSPTLLSSCQIRGQHCDTAEADLSPDGARLVARRFTDVATPADAGIMLVELRESLEGVVIAPARRVTGLDYSPRDELVVYSGQGEGLLDDLWVMRPNGVDDRNLTESLTHHERRPRIDPTGTVAVFDRAAPGAKSEIWIFVNRLDQRRVTSGGPGSGTLPGSDLAVGSDLDAVYSPDGAFLAFRRLAGLGDGRGDWELITCRTDGSALTVIAAGPGVRGAPDWGAGGIVFVESDAAGSRIVVVAADGSGRRTVAGVPAGFALSHPRWLR